MSLTRLNYVSGGFQFFQDLSDVSAMYGVSENALDLPSYSLRHASLSRTLALRRAHQGALCTAPSLLLSS